MSILGLADREGLLRICANAYSSSSLTLGSRGFASRPKSAVADFVERGSVHRSRSAIKKGPARGPCLMADREGFEPSNGFHRYTLSRRAPSTTRPPVHWAREIY